MPRTPEYNEDAVDKLASYQKKYSASEKGKAAERRYKEKGEGQRAVLRYRGSEKGYLARKRYRLSAKGKAAMARYQEKVAEFSLVIQRREAGQCVLCGASEGVEQVGRFAFCPVHKNGTGR